MGHLGTDQSSNLPHAVLNEYFFPFLSIHLLISKCVCHSTIQNNVSFVFLLKDISFWEKKQKGVGQNPVQQSEKKRKNSNTCEGSRFGGTEYSAPSHNPFANA